MISCGAFADKLELACAYLKKRVDTRDHHMHSMGRAGRKPGLQGKQAGWLRAAAVCCLLALFLAVPATAQAAFSSRASSSMSATTALLVAPATAATSVSAGCDSSRGYSQPRITVNSFGKVPSANYHELKVIAPDGQAVFVGDLSASGGNTYSRLATASAVRGKWTYEIRGYYRVPGTSRSWTGKALAGSFTCA
jgi:hypothetical protein